MAHEFINSRISADGNPLFVFAGTYPDMAFGLPEIPNAFHAPTPALDKPELNPDVPWKDSTNFAALWLDTVEESGIGQPIRGTDQTVGQGWGGHIASDWVAHTWLPLTDRPDLLVYHGLAETYADAYLMFCEGSFMPMPIEVQCDPRFLRGMVVSHALADYAQASPTAVKLRDYKLGLADLAEAEVLDLNTYREIEFWWPAKALVSPAAATALANAVTPFYVSYWAHEKRIPELLPLGAMKAAEWQADPTASGMPSLDFVTPLYDPDAPAQPPGAVEPPVVYTTGAAEEESGADPHVACDELYSLVVERAVESGLIVVTEGEADDGSGLPVYGATVEDQDALTQLFGSVIAELATVSDPVDGVSQGALAYAKALDRVINEGVVDPASLSVLIDGVPLAPLLADGAQSFTAQPAAPLTQGHHTMAVSISDRMGQRKTVDWPFDVALWLDWLPPLATRARVTWSPTQTLPVKFSLRDDDGVFGVDPTVTVRVYDPRDTSGERALAYSVGRGSSAIRIDLAEELYILNVKVKDIPWATAGTPLTVSVEAGGIVLGELPVFIRQ